jgi:hypothetical protein
MFPLKTTASFVPTLLTHLGGAASSTDTTPPPSSYIIGSFFRALVALSLSSITSDIPLFPTSPYTGLKWLGSKSILFKAEGYESYVEFDFISSLSNIALENPFKLIAGSARITGP